MHEFPPVDNLPDQLIRDENNKAKLYRDTSKEIGFEGRPGKVTIGVGHNIDDNGLSQHIRMLLLDEDIQIAKTSLIQRIPLITTVDPIRRDALVNMTFNMVLIASSSFIRQLL